MRIFPSIKQIQWLICMAAMGACSGVHQDPDKARKEILAAEKSFSTSAARDGIATAFYAFADDSAVIKRGGDTLIFGREGIRNFYRSPKYDSARVTWTADFASVSSDGTLGYTYGKYTWTMPGNDGKSEVYSGVFHTVWKRQADGSWKYVWD